MIDWTGTTATAPSPELLDEVVGALRSPDPVLRDELAFTRLAQWVPLLEPSRRQELGDRLAGWFTAPEIQARTFAPLVLARIVGCGGYDPAWLSAFTQWYPGERDLRGHDERLGWLHAVAHGADLLAAFGRCPRADPAPLLATACSRLLAPTAHVFDAMEDDRLGFALAVVLTRAELTESESLAWLEPIAADFAAAEPGPVPPYASNTMRTLRVLYLLADRGVRPERRHGEAVPLRHAAAVRERVAAVLAVNSPYAG
ncbi:DUF2785 domain-containing protein [Kitasatospora sp. NPDC059571]|uniref:DUF2785 domain-containing protein n=1 Tax=Kitasatospora sp. NPDC059571 TaxID=3346871 RepID=UPI00368AD06B